MALIFAIITFFVVSFIMTSIHGAVSVAFLYEEDYKPKKYTTLIQTVMSILTWIVMIVASVSVYNSLSTQSE